MTSNKCSIVLFSAKHIPSSSQPFRQSNGDGVWNVIWHIIHTIRFSIDFIESIAKPRKYIDVKSVSWTWWLWHTYIHMYKKYVNGFTFPIFSIVCCCCCYYFFLNSFVQMVWDVLWLWIVTRPTYTIRCGYGFLWNALSNLYIISNFRVYSIYMLYVSKCAILFSFHVNIWT